MFLIVYASFIFMENKSTVILTLLAIACILTVTFPLYNEYLPVPDRDSEINVEIDGRGSVDGAGIYDKGSIITLTAIPENGYLFKEWENGDKNPVREYTVENDVTLSAKFMIGYTLTAVFMDEDGNILENACDCIGEGAYESGEIAAITVIPEKGFEFIKWVIKNIDSFESTAKLQIDSDITIKAVFKVVPYTKLIVETDTPEAGTFDGAGLILVGETTILSVKTNNGYEFLGWYDKSGKLIPNSPVVNVFAPDAKDIIYVAKFSVSAKE